MIVGRSQVSTVGNKQPTGEKTKESCDRNAAERQLAQQDKQITNEPPSKRRFFIDNVATCSQSIQMQITRNFAEIPAANGNVQARSCGSTNTELHPKNQTIDYPKRFIFNEKNDLGSKKTEIVEVINDPSMNRNIPTRGTVEGARGLSTPC